MFKNIIGGVLATFASADINIDFHDILHGLKLMEETDLEPIWTQFKAEFEVHSPVGLGDDNAMYNFYEKLDSIIEHNSREDKTWTRGLNQYSAMTSEELAEHFHFVENQANADQNCSATGRTSPLTGGELGDSATPETWDWRNKGGVSPVKDQGNCGSCWTFSTVGCLESAHLIKYGVLQTYSEQQLVDCAGAFDNHGCNGGLPSHAFEYVHYTGGIATEDAYSYKGVDQNCTVKSSEFALSCDHSVNITALDENELKESVYQQPISVAFQVVDGFSDYSGGVYTSTSCANGPSDVNHAVLAVGYGHDEASGLDYWLVKNSWGTSWGDDGFFKIERGVNMCGIGQCNSYPKSVTEISHSWFNYFTTN